MEGLIFGILRYDTYFAQSMIRDSLNDDFLGWFRWIFFLHSTLSLSSYFEICQARGNTELSMN